MTSKLEATGKQNLYALYKCTHYTYFVSSVRSARRGLQFSKQHSALFGQAEMSLRIVQGASGDRKRRCHYAV